MPETIPMHPTPAPRRSFLAIGLALPAVFLLTVGTLEAQQFKSKGSISAGGGGGAQAPAKTKPVNTPAPYTGGGGGSFGQQQEGRRDNGLFENIAPSAPGGSKRQYIIGAGVAIGGLMALFGAFVWLGGMNRRT
jgi:hypothetical protein